jgi:tRNA uridine 5-carbamoylmethylation protein Kti12
LIDKSTLLLNKPLVDGMSERATTCLLVLVGLPGAGKSTTAKCIIDHLSSSSADIQATHIQFDDFYSANDGTKFNMDEWKRARAKALETIESHLTAPLADPPTSTSLYRLIIADDTFHLRSMRAHAHSLARKHQAAHIQLYIDTCLKQALLQNKARPNPLPDHIIVTAALHTMQSPASSSFPWDKKCLKYSEIQSLASDIQQQQQQQQQLILLWNVIWKEWGPPLRQVPHPTEVEAERDQARQATSANRTHQLDITLRSMVGKVMKEWISSLSEHENNKQHTKDLERDMTHARRLLLTKVHHGNADDSDSDTEYIVMQFAQQQESIMRRHRHQLQH